MRPSTALLLSAGAAVGSLTTWAGPARAVEAAGDSTASSPAAATADEPPPVWDPASTRPEEPPAEAQPSSPGTEATAPASASADTTTPPPPEAAPKKPGFAAALDQGDWLSAFGLSMTVGLAFGGEELVQLTYTDGSTDALRAGEGISLGGGLSWTPLWWGERFGLGLGMEAGWKYKSTSVDSDGSVKLERFPLTPSARALFAFTPSLHAVLAGGPTFEFGPHLWGDGVLNQLETRFDDAVGGMFELGVLGGRPRSFGWEMNFRYTFLSYKVMAESFDASHGTVNFRLYFFL